MKFLTVSTLSFFVATLINAAPVVDTKDFKEKIKKAAGEKGMFVKKENFPKDYFLVPKNLPFLVGLSLHHPKSDTLNLTKEQIEKIKEIKKKTVPEVLKTAKKIKALELKLVDNIAININTAQSQNKLVEEIGKLRIELTKKHLLCINSVRKVLSKKQYKILKAYSTKTPVKK